MQVGVVKEVKTDENRVALTPAGVEAFRDRGHSVLVEAGAGEGSGFSDVEYADAGARIVPKAAEVWAECEMVLKVKEPQAEEIPHIREDQIVFTYFHFAASEELTCDIVDAAWAAWSMCWMSTSSACAITAMSCPQTSSP